MSSSTLTATHCSFSSCTTTRDGGGIAVVNGMANISHSRFGSCSAGRGGGVHTVTSTVNLQRVVWSTCAATHVGGALHTEAAATSVELSSFRNNTASDGGALSGSFGSVSITGSSFTHNVARSRGGALFVESLTPSSVLCDLVIDGCTARGTGGGMFIGRSEAMISNISTIRCVADLIGGAIAVEDPMRGSLMHNITVDTCRSRRGGGLHVRGYGVDMSVTFSRFEGNSAASTGGGVVVEGASMRLLLREVELARNIAGECGGAGCTSDAAVLSLSGYIVVGNTAGRHGGAFWLQDAELELHSGTCANNSALAGGCVSAEARSHARISSSDLQNNEAKEGGSLWVDSAAVFTLDGSQVRWNNATRGGGCFNGGGSLEATSTRFEGNNASQYGGGIFNEGRTVLRNALLVENWATRSGADMYTCMSCPGATLPSLQGTTESRSTPFESTTEAVSLNWVALPSGLVSPGELMESVGEGMSVEIRDAYGALARDATLLAQVHASEGIVVLGDYAHAIQGEAAFRSTNFQLAEDVVAVSTRPWEFEGHVTLQGVPHLQAPFALSLRPCRAGESAADPVGGIRRCQQCPAGQFSQSSSKFVCTPCPVGHVSSSSGSWACQKCPKGSEAPTPGLTNCVRCLPSYYASAEGSATCTPCPPGHIAPHAGSDECSLCPAGSTNGTDARGKATCMPCPAGTFWMDNICLPCAPGTVNAVPGSTECQPCPQGTFNALPGSSQCTECRPGYYTNVSGSAVPCEPCPVGYYGSAHRAAQCLPCREGFYGNATNLTECVPCPPGSFNAVRGAAGCTPCSPGTAINVPGHDIACKDCEREFYSNSSGATTCTRCPPGFEAVSLGMKTCTPCPKGAHSGIIGGVCTACPSGQITNMTQQSNCTACPAGYSTNGLSGSTMCEVCPPGTYSPREGFEYACYDCGERTFNTFPGSTKCYECPVNKECTATGVVGRENWYYFEGLVCLDYQGVEQPCSGQCPPGYCGKNNECLHNRAGVLCGSCEDGYNKWGGSCVNEKNCSYLLVTIYMLGVAFSFVIYSTFIMSNTRASPRIIIFLLQSMYLVLKRSQHLNQSSSSNFFLLLLNVANLNVDWIPRLCYAPWITYYHVYVANLCKFFMLAACYLPVLGLHTVFVKRFPPNTDEPEGGTFTSKGKMKRYLTKHFYDPNPMPIVFFSFALFCYTPIVVATLETLSCQTIFEGSKEERLTADLSIVCRTGDGKLEATYRNFYYTANFLQAVFFALPFLFLLWIMYTKRKVQWHSKHDQQTPGEGLETLNRAYENSTLTYKPNFFWWEPIVMMRKALVMAILVYSTNVEVQGLAITAFFLLLLTLQLLLRPYMFTLDNRLEVMSLMMLSTFSLVLSSAWISRVTVTANDVILAFFLLSIPTMIMCIAWVLISHKILPHLTDRDMRNYFDEKLTNDFSIDMAIHIQPPKHHEKLAELKVLVQNAFNLPAMDVMTLSSDPYCILELGNEKRKTSVRKRTLNPTFEELFTFEVDITCPPVLRITLMDWDRWSNDDFIGKTVVNLSELAIGDWVHVHCDLEPEEKAVNPDEEVGFTGVHHAKSDSSSTLHPTWLMQSLDKQNLTHLLYTPHARSALANFQFPGGDEQSDSGDEAHEGTFPSVLFEGPVDEENDEQVCSSVVAVTSEGESSTHHLSRDPSAPPTPFWKSVIFNADAVNAPISLQPWSSSDPSDSGGDFSPRGKVEHDFPRAESDTTESASEEEDEEKEDEEDEEDEDGPLSNMELSLNSSTTHVRSGAASDMEFEAASPGENLERDDAERTFEHTSDFTSETGQVTWRS